ncbi:hypothetical protein HYV57_05420, partial [Candidatus Peregrinibacteria bacterium]|nr:hypothetical protein [Candidatus Peregrinibacteria bacterium]
MKKIIQYIFFFVLFTILIFIFAYYFFIKSYSKIDETIIGWNEQQIIEKFGEPLFKKTIQSNENKNLYWKESSLQKYYTEKEIKNGPIFIQEWYWETNFKTIV